jgi:hypothetical protein
VNARGTVASVTRADCAPPEVTGAAATRTPATRTRETRAPIGTKKRRSGRGLVLRDAAQIKRAFDRVSKIGTLVLPLESRFFPRLFFFETVHACESASREGKEVVAFSFFGATRAPRVHNSHGHQHRRLSPTLHQQPCVKSSPSTSARPVSRPVTRAGSCTASSTVSSLSTSDAGAAPFSGSFELPVRARNCRDLRGRRDANRATRDARECSSVREQSRGYSPRRFRARDRRATSTACRAVRATVRPRGGFSSRLTVASRMRADRISAPL